MMQSQNFSPGSRKLPRHALTSPWSVWRTLCDDCPVEPRRLEPRQRRVSLLC